MTPSRDAVIHQLAQDLLTRLNWAIERSSAPGIGDYYHIADTGLGHIKAALLHAQQVQREQDALYMQHKHDCEVIAGKRYIHEGEWGDRSWRMKPSDNCTCGLATLR